MASYHGPGTCTFYGTANTNQMLMEFMGLHLPGASFVNPGDPLREALTAGRGRTARWRSPRWATTTAPWPTSSTSAPS
jgi:phosphogluconate dehydratase